MQDSLIYPCGLQLFLYGSTQYSQYKLEVDDATFLYLQVQLISGCSYYNT